MTDSGAFSANSGPAAGPGHAQPVPGRARRAFVAFFLILIVALGALFDRAWLHGEVFSPGDLLESFYPWSYDTARREPSNATRSDEAFYHQPLIVTHWARLRAGDFPEHDPWLLAGVPSFHQGLDVGRAFAPVSVPFYLFPPDIAVTLFAPLRLLCAGLLMWWYLSSAGFAGAACAVGSVAFALNGAFIVWLSAPMPTVALWLPMLALGVERVATRGRLRDAALLGAATGFQLLGSYLPTSIAVATVTAVWAFGWSLVGRNHMAGRDTHAEMPAQSRRVVLIVVGTVSGLLLAAVSLGPMMVNLLRSPAGSRSMRAFTLPWQNLATFVLPDFWGTPLNQTWWFPGPGNYPELVTYLGVTTVVLAGLGVWNAMRRHGARDVLACVVALFALMQMYGVPPVSWVTALPGFRQMNPYRWNVGLAFAMAVLAASAVDWLARRRPAPGSTGSQTLSGSPGGLRDFHVVSSLGVVVGIVGLLGLVTAAALFSHLELIRQLGVQASEKRQVVRFLALGLSTCALVFAAQARAERVRRLAPWLLSILVALDLVLFGHGFNPFIPRDRLYRATPGIAMLQQQIGQGRIAPVGASYELPQSHVWGLFGLPSITGFDFFGDAGYQAFVRAASGAVPAQARWDYVGIEDDHALDLRLLGLLGVNLVVTPPTDRMTHAAGYTTVGELNEGRRLVQTWTARNDGLRRIDLLAGTFRRTNAGVWRISLFSTGADQPPRDALRRSAEAFAKAEAPVLQGTASVLQGASASVQGASASASEAHAPTVGGTESPVTGGAADRTLVGSWRIDTDTLHDVDWLRLEFATQAASHGRQYDLEIESLGAHAGHSATLFATPGGGLDGGTLEIDGKPDPRALWVRTFSTAPDKIAGATLLYSSDLNVYRNPFGAPRAWFARESRAVPSGKQLDALRALTGPVTDIVLVDATMPTGSGARVIAIDTTQADRRVVDVDAPNGGVLVLAERFDPHWRLAADGHSVPLVPANAVLMAAAVPPGSRHLVLAYSRPDWALAMAISGFGALGIALALFYRV